MANVMSALGFTVYRGIDLDTDGLEKCLGRFTAELQAKRTDIALFFYAGHGIQLVSEKDNEKRNYMMATDANIDWWGRGTGYKQIDAVLNQMRDHSEQSVFFYDACRDYPLGNQRPASIDGNSIKRGIAMIGGPAAMSLKQKEADDRAGIYIAYATAPNRVADDAYERGADHSPFTKALLNHIATPGHSLKQAMSYVSKDVGELTDWNQTPWTSSSLTEDVRLNGPVDKQELRALSEELLISARDSINDGNPRLALAATLKALPKTWPREERRKNFGTASELLFKLQSLNPVYVSEHEGFGTSILDFAISPNGDHIVTASSGGNAKIWNARTGELEKTLNLRCVSTKCRVTAVAISSLGQIAVGTSKGDVTLAEAQTGMLLRSYKEGSHSIRGLEFTKDGMRLMIHAVNKGVIIRHTQSGVKQAHLGVNFLKGVNPKLEDLWYKFVDQAALSTDGKLLAALYPDGIAIFDIRGRKRTTLIEAAGLGGSNHCEILHTAEASLFMISKKILRKTTKTTPKNSPKAKPSGRLSFQEALFFFRGEKGRSIALIKGVLFFRVNSATSLFLIVSANITFRTAISRSSFSRFIRDLLLVKFRLGIVKVSQAVLPDAELLLNRIHLNR